MKRLSALFTMVFLLACWTVSTVEAATLHTIIVVDTDDPSIGKSVLIDATAMESEVRSISVNTSLKLNPKVFAGKNLIRDDVLEYLKRLQIKSDDSVIFFWAGHGYRTNSKSSKWPALFFGWHQKGLDFKQVIKIIRDKKPNMALIMADTCNNVIDEESAPSFKDRFLFSNDYSKGYKALFRDFHGIVVTTSADVGETAKGNTATGGYYTHAFLNSLRNEIYNSKRYSWEAIIQVAQGLVSDYEHPIYEIYKD